MTTEELPAPFVGYRTEIKPEWIDFNGHFNAGFYCVVFDDAISDWMAFLGLDRAHRDAHEVTTFTVEGHITYERELRQGDPIEIRTQLLDWDAKKLHYIHFMHHRNDGFVAATNEVLSLHISQRTRRSAPMAPEIVDRVNRVGAAHRVLATPPQVGRVIGVKAGRAG